ncbi:hypothetical protein OIV83_001420 [Microbotryomycetes sp. JL201]|nr:hypothetical protein OIV83_001420 [Microbotryomycetes sp. JL201]
MYLSQFAPHLSGLLSLKLTHPGPGHPQEASFFDGLETIFIHARRLEAFTLYHSGVSGTESRVWPVLPQTFIESVGNTVGRNLNKFECSNILIPLDRMNLIEHVAVPLSQLNGLRTLHILSQYPDIPYDQVVWLASQCTVTLRQIGLRNRVWHVDRVRPSKDSGETKKRTGIRLVETAEAFGAFRRSRYGAEEDAEPGSNGDSAEEDA